MPQPDTHDTHDLARWVSSLDAPAALMRCDGRVLAENARFADVTRGRGRREPRRTQPGEACEQHCHDWQHEQGEDHWDVSCLRLIVDDDLGCLCTLGAPTGPSPESRRAAFVGCSPAHERAMSAIERAAACAAPTLLLGETGTGKELAAREIHARSARAAKPLVCVDCPTLSGELFASELFGHEKGAFTGAATTKLGLVEACNGGTLFLDEIGDLAPAQQAKLLRLLDNARFRRVGGTVERQADFRLICATNKDLVQMTASGQFRADLYHRINVLPITLAPLRDHLEDVPVLIVDARRRLGLHPNWRITAEALAALCRHDYPGNVRELHNIIARGSLTGDGVTLSTGNLSEALGGRAGAEEEPGRVLTLAEVEHQYLRRVASAHGGTRRNLARQLGVSERTLYRRLKATQQRRASSAAD